jgi:DNA-directed RNA polymerase sigma subunit (sigma70/sigma32)
MNAKDQFEYTIKEISQELNISEEKCRQVLLMALKKLKNPQYNTLLNEVANTLEELQNEG